MASGTDDNLRPRCSPSRDAIKLLKTIHIVTNFYNKDASTLSLVNNKVQYKYFILHLTYTNIGLLNNSKNSSIKDSTKRF